MSTNSSVIEINALDLHKRKLDIRPPLISELLREGQTLMFTAASKSGKSFFLLQLALCLAAGKKFMNRFECQKSRVLLVDLENGDEDCKIRLDPQIDALGVSDEDVSSVDFQCFNGIPSDFVETVVKRALFHRADVVIIDPLYRIFPGEENSSTVALQLMDMLDRIKRETGCTLIFSHHHSKGNQFERAAIDRGSGSGILARAVQSKVDMTQIYISLDGRKYESSAKAFEVSVNLRSFPDIDGLTAVFDYPLFVVDPDVKRPSGRGSGKRQAEKAKKLAALKKEYRLRCGSNKQPVSLKEIAAAIGVAERTARGYLDDLPEFSVSQGLVYERP